MQTEKKNGRRGTVEGKPEPKTEQVNGEIIQQKGAGRKNGDEETIKCDCGGKTARGGTEENGEKKTRIGNRENRRRKIREGKRERGTGKAKCQRRKGVERGKENKKRNQKKEKRIN